LNRRLTLAVPLILLAACPGNGKNEPEPPPPTHLYAAKAVIGQGSFNAIPDTAACGAGTLVQPTGPVAWNGTTFLAPDTFSMRILAFSVLPGSSVHPVTSWVIGDSATTFDACDGVATFLTPQSLFLSGTKLVVSDPALGQVFLYDPIPADSGASAVPVAVGTADDTASGLYAPEAAILVGTKLFVADTQHNRVLVWDPAPSDPAAATPAATFVLGQAGFTTGGATPAPLVAYNDTDADGFPGATLAGPPVSYDTRPSASVMRAPAGLWSDGTRLIVADTGNNRLLVWNTLPTTSGAAADRVVGQATFTTAVASAGTTGLDRPYAIAFDGTRYFVADYGNNRVVVYPATLPAMNGVAATAVLGQRTFAGNAPNDDDGDGTPDATPSAGSLDGPTGVAWYSPGRLFVTDTYNGRVLVFDPPTP
jgi:hypothetical protein